MKLEDLNNLKTTDIQPFFSSGVQIYHIIDWVIQQTGPVHLLNTTFSVAEEFLRAIFRLKSKGMILSSVEIADLKSAAKTQKVNDLLRGVFDEVYLAENHSKVILLWNDDYKITIITSQNQTRGNRNEGGIIINDTSVFEKMKNEIMKMIEEKSVKWAKGEPLPNRI